VGRPIQKEEFLSFEFVDNEVTEHSVFTPMGRLATFIKISTGVLSLVGVVLGYFAFQYDYRFGTAYASLCAVSLAYFYQNHCFLIYGFGPYSLPSLLKDTEQRKMRCLVISDTHNKHMKLNLPPADILIHCGDFTMDGTDAELMAFMSWFRGLNYEYKVFVPGNHDRGLDPKLSGQAVAWIDRFREYCHLLINDEVTIEGLKIYGSPHTRSFKLSKMSDKALTDKKRSPIAYALECEDLAEVWENIPENCDILITHGPGNVLGGALLLCGKQVGDKKLGLVVKEKAPKFHCFGHIHESYGVHQGTSTTSINAASCTLLYNPDHPGILFDILI